MHGRTLILSALELKTRNNAWVASSRRYRASGLMISTYASADAVKSSFNPTPLLQTRFNADGHMFERTRPLPSLFLPLPFSFDPDSSPLL
ncbi:hypothetical protein PM082_006461 [Marasmius tenuissimus]|nr:hypothetical protein PM082_006461 [Marasmius tenuissimus]